MKYVKAGIMMFTRARPDVFVALVKGSYSGKWGFPKGNIDPGETPKQAAVREFKEETGVNVLEPMLEYRLSVTGEAPKLLYVSVVNTRFEMNPEDSEISEARWFNVKDLNRDPKFTYDVRLLSIILKGNSRIPAQRELALFINSL